MESCKLGYLAGMLDGEGSITIDLYRKVYTRADYKLHVTITNKNIDCLKFIQNEFGGSLYSVRSNYGTTIYRLQWLGNAAKDMLRTVVDKLIVKREQAELALLFPVNVVYQRRYTEAEKEFRHEIYLKHKKLTRRETQISFGEPREVRNME